MAKKKDVQPAQPVISSLPLPATDNPLVIDLPDGQKLVVGKMETGTVIEVATWRGTGRPDSRTSRLMLGMSSGDPSPQSNSEDAEASNTNTGKSNSNKYTKELSKIVSKIVEFLGFAKSSSGDNKTVDQSEDTPRKSLFRKSSKFKVKAPKPNLNFKKNKSDDLADPDFQNWLDSVTKKNAKLANFSTQSAESKGKIKVDAKTEVKAPVKKVAKKAAPKARRSR
jgi:hypothetical protein